MEQLLPYIVKSVLVSGVLTAYYLIALRNRRFHGYNRVYLLSVLVVSLLLPLVRIDWQPFAGFDWQPFFTRGRDSTERIRPSVGSNGYPDRRIALV